MPNKQNLTYFLILLLLAVIAYLILTRPDTEKPAIIKHETEIKQDTHRIDSLLLRQEELRLQLKEDSLKSKSREKAFKMRVATLEQKLSEQRAKVQELIDSVPALNAFVDTQDSIISVKSERIAQLSEDKTEQWEKFNALILASDEKFNASVEINSHFKAINEIRKKENRRIKKANRLLMVALPVSFVAGIVLAK